MPEEAQRAPGGVFVHEVAATLSALAGSVLRGKDALPALLTQAQDTFGMTSVTLLERIDDDRAGET